MYSMLITFLLLFLTMPSFVDVTQRDDSPVIYLLPGQGADCRLFKNIDFPYDTIHLEFPIPEKKLRSGNKLIYYSQIISDFNSLKNPCINSVTFFIFVLPIN